MPILSLISALGKKTRAIGKNNALLWRIPEDLARFKQITQGHPIIMGCKTFESIGRPLPERTNIVLTLDPTWTCEGVTPAHTLDEAVSIASARDQTEIFIIGGGSVYAQTIARADRLYLTLVEDDAPGDTFFPPYEDLPFRVTEEVAHISGTLHYQFVLLERVRADTHSTP
jgi:dihydrofolate reductase